MRRSATLTATAGLFLLPLVLAFSQGGYFDTARLRAAIAACLIAAVAAVVSERPLPRSLAGRVALGGMVALTGWVALSMTWAPLAGPAIDDVERLVLYLAALTAAIALLGPPAGRWTEPLMLGVAVVAAAYGLSERLLPGLVSLTPSVAAGDRLAQPLTYWNAQGALSALGLILAAGLVAANGRRAGADPAPGTSAPDRSLLLRVGAAATAPVLGLDLYLTLSRGALGALAAGLVVLVALTPTRAALEAAVLVGVAAALAALVAVLVFGDVLHTRSSTGQGAGMLAVLVLLTGAAGAIAARPARPPLRIGWLRPVAVVALIASLAVTVTAAAHSGHAGAPAATSGRLVSVASNRYAYWRVAVHAFENHPLAGVGTSGFRVEWLKHRHFGESVRDAHSIYLETGAELGIVGLIALFALFGGVAASVRPECAGAGAALAAFAVHAGVDWDWEMPALTLVAILLAGRVISSRPARAP
jgi:hypothetical protein